MESFIQNKDIYNICLETTHKYSQNKNKISKEDANRLLEALQNQEKNTQEKLKLERLEKGKSIGIEKKW